MTEAVDGREVTVYVPAAPAQAVVLAGDGQVLAPWGADLQATDLPPTMVVGVHRFADETARVQEYALDPGAHVRFLVRAVRPWVASRFGVDLPAGRTAALGVSASAELALALGLRHPDVVGTVLAASPGAGYRPPDELPAALPRVYLLAATREPFFHDNAERWATALRLAGADVAFVQRDGAHGGSFWRAELPRMIAWAFGGLDGRRARGQADAAK